MDSWDAKVGCPSAFVRPGDSKSTCFGGGSLLKVTTSAFAESTSGVCGKKRRPGRTVSEVGVRGGSVRKASGFAVLGGEGVVVGESLRFRR
jgi:hypothetical protein